MLDFFQGKFKEILVILTLVLILVTVNAVHKTQDKARWYDKAVVFITAPLQYVVDVVIKGSARLTEDYVFVQNVKEDNKRLLKENQKLLYKLNQLAELSFENSRLMNMLGLKEKMSINMISSVVIAEDINSSFKSVRIDRGEEDGVGVAMPVINYYGVVGQVTRVFPKYSDVMLVTDPNSAIDTIVQESRARGILKGQGEPICKLKYLNRLDDVKVGSKLVTSGVEQRFPKGLAIGEVVKVNRKNYGVTQEVIVRPTVEFDKLEEVFVIKSQKI
jgi:rod shape-determining protein MreC